MIKSNTIIILLFLPTSVFGQSNKKLAYQKAVEAINLMDIGKVDESIVLRLKISSKFLNNLNASNRVTVTFHFLNK